FIIIAFQKLQTLSILVIQKWPSWTLGPVSAKSRDVTLANELSLLLSLRLKKEVIKIKLLKIKLSH
ncbi:MAG: hypothetical protein IJ563_02670, partial [Selenomonadaceae bacterium]|nr:hypothetical protein [Selenomonadaceae bacterium]